MSLFPNETANDLASVVDVLSRVRTNEIRWFRGQSKARYKLVPSLARLPGDWLANEPILTSRFQQNASALIPMGPRSAWDWLLLMQHYGVPTRLLDWTENPLAALYFATLGDARSSGVLWVLDPTALNVASKVGTGFGDMPTLESPNLNPYLPENVTKSVTLGPAAVLAMRQFPRMVAQSGVFTVAQKDATPIEKIRAGALVGKVIIPRGYKAAIQKELNSVGVTRLALFPELESVAAATKEFIKK